MTAPERVYVVPAADVLDSAGPWRGVRSVGADELDRLASAGSYRPRDEMERDPAFKQVIPYLVVRDGPSYFLMRRTRAGGDERLHERWSIGVGGHLNEGDGGLEGGLRREWAEEIDAAFEPEFRLVGLLNDDESDVGRVHVGVVYLAEAGGGRWPSARSRSCRAGWRRARKPRRSSTGWRHGARWSSSTSSASRRDEPARTRAFDTSAVLDRRAPAGRLAPVA